MILLFFKAVLIGLSIAMPIGPIATFLIKNSLTKGFKAGLAVGLGAALVEALYSFVAASGFAFVARFLDNYLDAMKLFCGCLLVFLAIFEIKSCNKNSVKELKIEYQGFCKTTVVIMLLTMANPLTIVFFAGVFATMSGNNFDALSIAVISFGAFVGSLSWTAFLSYTISRIRHKISPQLMISIRLISSWIIAAFGLYGMASI